MECFVAGFMGITAQKTRVKMWQSPKLFEISHSQFKDCCKTMMLDIAEKSGA